MIKIDNPARRRLENGELALGVGVRSARGVEIAMAMKTSGYDFLFIDLEHGAMSLDVATQISTAALGVGIARARWWRTRYRHAACRDCRGSTSDRRSPKISTTRSSFDVHVLRSC